MFDSTTPYRVLARKYRPRNFDELIGQDALVRTLRNAIQSGRIAHAFMLTGVRGVGKTTTARIIAKALNYKGPDGTSGPTTGPTDDCALCRAIAEDLTRRSVRLSLGGSVYDPTDPVGRLLFNVLAMVAEFSVISTRRSGEFPEVGALA